MDMTLFLLSGVALAALHAYKVNRLSLVLTVGYWLAWLLFLLHTPDHQSAFPFSWIGSIDINLSFRIDALGKLFGELIAGIGVLIFAYSWSYTTLKPTYRTKLFSILQLFAVAMMGVVLADDAIVMFLCWEATTITSYLLIQFHETQAKANEAAFAGMFITVAGGLLMLLGFIVLQQESGSWSFTIMLQQSLSTNTQTVIIFLLFAGAMTKSAQFPFHFWLPGAMAAPTPVSAYLHSATMVNAGIYLLARFHPLLSQHVLWYGSLTGAGMLTMIFAAYSSLRQKDLKLIMAQTTLYALGAMIYLLGSPQAIAIEAFAVFFIFHGLYKAAAFMLVGYIDNSYGTRDMNKLVGIGRHHFLLGLLLLVTLASMAGLPPFFGFTVKELMFEAKLAKSSIAEPMMLISLFGGVVIAAASYRVALVLFQPAADKRMRSVHDIFMLIPPLVACLAITCLSIYPAPLMLFVTEVALTVIPKAKMLTYELYDGYSLALTSFTALSGIALTAALWFSNNHITQAPARDIALRVYKKLLRLSLFAGGRSALMIQRQSIQTQLLISVLTVSLMMLVGLYYWELYKFLTFPEASQRLVDKVIFLLFIGLSASLIFYRGFINNLLSLSLLGLATSYYFMTQGAPDLAITQLLVEVLTIIIILVALKNIRLNPDSTRGSNSIIKSVAAISFGLITSIAMALSTMAPVPEDMKQYFLANSLAKAFGKNVVNVILVDFRAYDTFGEVIVIIATAIIIYLLVTRHQQPR